MSKLCILPWISVETSPLGEIRPCCLALDPITGNDGKPVKVSKTTLQQAFNSDYMQSLRRDFINGIQPKTCNRCWDEEAAGRTSKRMNSMYRLRDLIADVDFTSEDSDNLIFLDLKLGNICNLKCRICGSFSSSKWAQEELKIYPNNPSPKNNLIEGRWPRESQLFWDDLNLVLPKIRYMEFTGGEPFLIEEHFDLLQKAVDLGYAKNIEIHYNTNTTIVPSKGLDLWPHFKTVEIAVSIDDIGPRFEYQRYGTNWEESIENLNLFKKLRNTCKNITLQICLTVNVQNVYYLDELIHWVTEQNFDFVYFNMLHTAWYYNIRNLNQAAKDLINDKFSKLTLPYQDEIDRILTFMNQGQGSNCQELIKNLKQSDQQRNQHFSDHHPEIAKAIGYVK